MEAAGEIFKRDGLSGFWRGIGPALVLVINPVIQVSIRHTGTVLNGSCQSSWNLKWIKCLCQYTTYERLVGALLAWRAARHGVTPRGKQLSGRSSLTDWDLFLLGAASKLVATGVTYPYVGVNQSFIVASS